MNKNENLNGFLEPSFDFLVTTLRMQAEMQMGLFRMSEDDKASPNLPMARHFIDLLAMLIEKTKGNLSMEESRFIENTVTELRFRFVQASQEETTQEKKEPASAPESAG
jgi:hypothetical protein